MSFEPYSPVSQALLDPLFGALLVAGLWSYWFGGIYARYWIMRCFRLAGLVLLIMLIFYLIGVLAMAAGAQFAEWWFGQPQL